MSRTSSFAPGAGGASAGMRSFVLACAASAAALFAGQAVAQHGDFLPTPPFGLGNGDNEVRRYGNLGPGNNPIRFTGPVTDSTKNINAGQIKFDYDTYSGGPAGGMGADTFGGAAISGGFFMNNGVGLKPEFDNRDDAGQPIAGPGGLHWVQTVTATNTGSAGMALWNLPAMNAGEYPDVLPAPNGNGRNDPIYPFESAATAPPMMMPTLGFQDFPSRGYAGGAQSWIAELGLVAISETPHINMMGMMFYEVRVINTFLWGFDFVDLNGNTTIDGIGEIQAGPAPSFWSDPTQSYLDTLNDFFDGGTATKPTGKFKFFNNDNVFIPAPSSLALLAAGGIIAFRRRRA